MNLPAIPFAIGEPIAPLVDTAAAVPLVVASPPILPLWHALRSQYQALRPVIVAPEGDSYPETTAGDVRLASIHLSRALCNPRFDHAQLTDARAAWRDAIARAAAILARIGWNAPFPDNRRFWLSDSRALAQQLGAVEARRNGITAVDGRPRVAGAYPDLSVLWNDLRHWYLERRFVRRSRGHKYPETSVADVREVARLLTQYAGLDPSRPYEERLAAVGGQLMSAAVVGRRRIAPLVARWNDATARWRAVQSRIEGLAGERADADTYPDNPRFWLVDAKQFADEAGALRRSVEGDR